MGLPASSVSSWYSLVSARDGAIKEVYTVMVHHPHVSFCSGLLLC